MDDSWRSRITFEPGKRGGRPCIRGMRITVHDVLSYLAAGMTVDEVLHDFPYLVREDIEACFAFVAEQRAELARRDAEMDANPGMAMTWEQIRASVERKPLDMKLKGEK